MSDNVNANLFEHTLQNPLHSRCCHECGNIRKKALKCNRCPRLFCSRCCDRMRIEFGIEIFQSGCPVCKDLCCCGTKRSLNCLRPYHCYKKCLMLNAKLKLTKATSEKYAKRIITLGEKKELESDYLNMDEVVNLQHLKSHHKNLRTNSPTHAFPPRKKPYVGKNSILYPPYSDQGTSSSFNLENENAQCFLHHPMTSSLEDQTKFSRVSFVFPMNKEDKEYESVGMISPEMESTCNSNTVTTFDHSSSVQSKLVPSDVIHESVPDTMESSLSQSYYSQLSNDLQNIFDNCVVSPMDATKIWIGNQMNDKHDKSSDTNHTDWRGDSHEIRSYKNLIINDLRKMTSIYTDSWKTSSNGSPSLLPTIDNPIFPLSNACRITNFESSLPQHCNTLWQKYTQLFSEAARRLDRNPFFMNEPRSMFQPMPKLKPLKKFLMEHKNRCGHSLLLEDEVSDHSILKYPINLDLPVPSLNNHSKQIVGIQPLSKVVTKLKQEKQETPLLLKASHSDYLCSDKNDSKENLKKFFAATDVLSHESEHRPDHNKNRTPLLLFPSPNFEIQTDSTQHTHPIGKRELLTPRTALRGKSLILTHHFDGMMEPSEDDSEQQKQFSQEFIKCGIDTGENAARIPQSGGEYSPMSSFRSPVNIVSPIGGTNKIQMSSSPESNPFDNFILFGGNLLTPNFDSPDPSSVEIEYSK